MTEAFLDPVEVIVAAEGSARLDVREQLLTDTRVKPFTSVTFAVDDYHVEGGFPVADTALGILAANEAWAGTLVASATPAEVLAAQTGAVCRWLPLEGTFDDPTVWRSATGSLRLALATDDTTPVLDTDYEYARGSVLVPGAAMRMSGQDSLACDSVRWARDSVAFAVVAVLHTPLLDAYGVLETYPGDGVNPDRSFVSVRYTRDGSVQTHAQGLQEDRQTSSQGVRTGQPVIVALRLSEGLLATTVVVDRTQTVAETHLSERHPNDARLYVGRSPMLTLGSAAMDVLEVDYFEDVSEQELLDATSVLDALYGVST